MVRSRVGTSSRGCHAGSTKPSVQCSVRAGVELRGARCALGGAAQQAGTPQQQATAIAASARILLPSRPPPPAAGARLRSPPARRAARPRNFLHPTAPPSRRPSPATPRYDVEYDLLSLQRT
ncbi:unnamed protein product, partial [Iphiclides podalirius]